jgi:hypothetical protein
MTPATKQSPRQSRETEKPMPKESATTGPISTPVNSRSHNHMSTHVPSLQFALLFGRRTVDVIFYDPISSNQSGLPSQAPLGAAIKNTRERRTHHTEDPQLARTQAIGAVIRDLERLALIKDSSTGPAGSSEKRYGLG